MSLIWKCLWKQFQSLPKGGKPKANEFTVLAGIVMERTDNDCLRCVALGTGLKALPFKQLSPSGNTVNDSHAEVICRRSFKRFLLHQMALASAEKDPDSIFSFTPRDASECEDEDPMRPIFHLKAGIRFYFYVSQSPCGDASMDYLIHAQTEEERISNELKKKQFLETHSGEEVDPLGPLRPLVTGRVLRGRMEFEERGIARTKPSRIDSDLSASMSCTDKMTRWNGLGWGGSIVALLAGTIRMDAIIVAEGFHKESLGRSLIDRVLNSKLGMDFESNLPILLEDVESPFPFSRSTLGFSASPCSTGKRVISSHPLIFV